MTDHLSREQLLRYMDGELSRVGMSAAVEHLESCWACRAELDRLEADIAAIINAQSQCFVPSLPAPPRPWPRIEPRLHAAEENRNRTLLWKRTPLSGLILRHSIGFTAVALTAMLMAIWAWLPVRPVSAKEVLRRLEEADAKRLAITPQQVIHQRVRVKQTRRQTAAVRTSALESWKSSKSTYWNSRGDIVDSELQELYKANGLAPELPLSATTVAAWTKLVGSEPRASRDLDDSIHVTLSSSSHPARPTALQELSFHVRPHDWHVDEVKLSFADTAFEITEEQLEIVDRRSVAPDALAALELLTLPPAPAPSAAATSLPSAPTLERQPTNPGDIELGVRYDLHRIGADLGENIEVASGGDGKVVLNAWNISTGRRAQLAALFEGRLGVRLEFAPPEERTATSGQSQSKVVVIPQQPLPPQQRDERLAKFFGSAEAEENYTRALLQTTTDMLSHFYALGTLADRWPSSADVQLSPGARVKLSAMLEDHARQLRIGLKELGVELEPMLKEFGYKIRSDESSGGTVSWQQVSVAGLAASKRIDHALRSLLTTTASPASPDDALLLTQQAFGELRGLVRSLPGSSGQK